MGCHTGRTTRLHFVSSPRDELRLWGQMPVRSHTARKVLTAQWPWDLAPGLAAEFDCLKKNRPSACCPLPTAGWEPATAGFRRVRGVGQAPAVLGGQGAWQAHEPIFNVLIISVQGPPLPPNKAVSLSLHVCQSGPPPQEDTICCSLRVQSVKTGLSPRATLASVPAEHSP